jgi:hypothetical protein
MRALASSRRILVSTPLIAAQIEGETDPECLTYIPSLAFGADDEPVIWRLVGPGEREKIVRLTPRLTCVSSLSCARPLWLDSASP